MFELERMPQPWLFVSAAAQFKAPTRVLETFRVAADAPDGMVHPEAV